MGMPSSDPLTPLMALSGVEENAAAAVSAIARVHRRPEGLRKFEVISSESLLRGARACAAIDGASLALADVPPTVSAYSLLAPEVQATTVRTFARAPLQVLARIDVASGGPGKPAQEPAVAHALAQLITRGAGVDYDRLLPVVLHAEIAARELFGERSTVVALVAARTAAIHTGFDPRGFAVPETYLNRNRTAYRSALSTYGEAPTELLTLLLHAWTAGAKEADGIARAA
ncbi:oxidoreductase [Corynebacterium minutissimum]|uniref:Oxidoreductase n=2 Tax=Corynebacterium minutissimum TaxID=38301 RepID=A0A376CS04_9CORY|nr:oxidoreductase [Corynebacterium minutissimum]QRP59951.1 oxidoreductase [Corynebacterium minutissimum]STC74029.1 Uncharacterised protein [Corynebacterium minutissimum]